MLRRDWAEAETPWGMVRVKRGWWQGRVVTAAPEFEDCRKLAEAHGVAIRDVMAAAALRKVHETT